MDDSKRRVRVPWFQPLSVVRGALAVYDGTPKERVETLRRTLFEQRGTPQNQVDWSNPGEWIDERLSGDLATLARRFWEESKHVVNPRWLDGPDFLIRTYELARVDTQGAYRLPPLGRDFVDEKPEAIRHVDEGEGMLSTQSEAKYSDLIGEWTEFVHKYSNFQAESSVRDSLRRRLGDLRDRGLVEWEGHRYSITRKGMGWLDASVAHDPARKTIQAVKSFNASQRKVLGDRLATMSPYVFEHLVGMLLSAMGYEDVEVTKQSGDKGVDVVGTVQFGITTVREVVQVKRVQGSIGRPVLDQLRGSLPYQQAIRGTIITTGSFSSGCKDRALFPGAAPITLIDGEHLLDLLIEHRIGIKERPARLIEVDEEFFSTEADAEEEGV
jgi:restriction system protein